MNDWTAIFDLAMFSESLAASAAEESQCVCANCGSHLRRLARKGFFQNALYPLFGYYPWECFACRTKSMLRVRGKRVFHRIWDEALDEPMDSFGELAARMTPGGAPSCEEDSSRETECSQAVPPGAA